VSNSGIGTYSIGKALTALAPLHQYQSMSDKRAKAPLVDKSDSPSTTQSLHSLESNNGTIKKRKYERKTPYTRTHRSWEISPRETATILEQAALGVPANAIARQISRAPQSVCNVLKRFQGVFTELVNVKDYTQVRSPVLDAAELRMLKSLMDEASIEKATLNNRAYAYRQIVDSNRLWKGLSTSNQSTRTQFSGTIDLPTGALEPAPLVEQNNNSIQLSSVDAVSTEPPDKDK
jgi:hypothetical protein